MVCRKFLFHQKSRADVNGRGEKLIKLVCLKMLVSNTIMIRIIVSTHKFFSKLLSGTQNSFRLVGGTQIIFGGFGGMRSKKDWEPLL